MATPMSRAKTLLRMNQNEIMTGYTPQGKEYFVDAGAWYTTPQRGDIIYFYSEAKGRIGHVGIVTSVDSASKIVHTVEGNTTSSEYSENGGCVARHSYSYAKIGGTNRVNGFGRPDFKGAGVTVDEFISTALSYLGYMEKASNSQLDSFTANAGSNNYQKFQRDIGAGNGDQWCQFYVSAIALYTCEGKSGSSSSSSSSKAEATSSLNETAKFHGYVTASSLNVRTGPGADFDKVSFSPLPNGTKVGVCDELESMEGDKWYYISYNGKHGFVSAAYISKSSSDQAESKKKITAEDISVAALLKSAKTVMDKAQKEGWQHGTTKSKVPCKDGVISGVSLVTRALYDLGFTDQISGGETYKTLDKYLQSHGFKRSTKLSAIRKGSIVLVKHEGKNSISHVFIALSFVQSTLLTSRYDAGTQQRIETDQPLKNVKWTYKKDDVIIYNLPSSASEWHPCQADYKTGLLRIFETPSSTAKVLRRIPYGGRMETDGKMSGIFIHVRNGNVEGWAKERYVKRSRLVSW